MNVGELKRALQHLPDDALVVVQGPDHSYRLAHVPWLTQAEAHDDGHLCEWYGPENACDPPSKVVTVLWVG
jgi:hypothetical protein